MSKKEYYTCPISLTSQFYFCPMPLRLDTYSGCINNCVYCFANNSSQKFMNDKKTDINKMRGQFTNKFVKPTKLKYVKKYFDIAFKNHKNTLSNQEGAAIPAIRRRVPMHFGGMSDGFQQMEKTERVSLNVLKLLKSYDYPLIISTKCKLISEDEYYNVIKDYKNIGIQVSLIDNRQEVANIIEPGLGPTSVQDRLDILNRYKDKWTAVRIQPFIINLTENIIDGFLEQLKTYNVNHIVIEGLKFMSSNKSVNMFISETFKKITGKEYDLLRYYKSIGAKCSGTDIELPSWRKEIYMKKIIKKCKELGMTVGAADNDLRLLGDNPCCCGNKDMPGIENVNKHNIGFATFRAQDKCNGNCCNCKVKIEYDDIKNEKQFEGNFRVVKSIKSLKKKYGENATYHGAEKDISELFDKQWNSVGKNSPEQNFYVIKTNKFDKNNMRIYRFKTEEELNLERIPKNQSSLNKWF